VKNEDDGKEEDLMVVQRVSEGTMIMARRR